MEQRESVRSNLLRLTYRPDLVLWTTEAQYRQALASRCPGRELEIEAILAALRHQIVEEMLRLRHSTPYSVLLPKMARWLVQQSGLNMIEASWAVESWAMALRITRFTDSDGIADDLLCPCPRTFQIR